MTTYECLRCGTRLAAEDDRLTAGHRTCPDCRGPLRDLALPQE